MLIHSTADAPIMCSQPENISDPQIRIMPGITDIPDKTWTAIKPHLATKISTGVLTEKMVTTKKDGKNGDVVVGKSFTELEPAERTAIIALTVDQDLLERWRGEAKNDQAAYACTKRIEELRAKFDKARK